MKAIVINQRYQDNLQLTTIQHKRYQINLGQNLTNPDNLESYATVLEQSLTTNDSAMIEEILSNEEDSIINNTLLQLNKSKIGQLLGKCQELLLRPQSNTKSLAKWLKILMKLHLSTIANSYENKSCIVRIRKFISIKAQGYSDYVAIKKYIPVYQFKPDQKTKPIPRFSYQEQEVIKKDQQQLNQEYQEEQEEGFQDQQDFDQQF